MNTLNEYKDTSLNPNNINLIGLQREIQPVRPSSASLSQFDTLNKKTAKLKIERPTRGNQKGSKIYTHEDLLIEVNGALQFDEITDKVHNYALIQLVQTHKNKIVINLHEYMALTGLKDRKNAQQQLSRSIHNLVGIKISRNNLNELSVKQKKYEPFTHDTVIYTDGAYTRGRGWIEFNPNFANTLTNTTSTMIYPKKLFQLKGTAYYLLNALLYNKQVNYHNSESKQNRMKFGTILKRCPNLPTWDAVRKGNKRFGFRIVKPLKKAIEELKDEISCSFIDTQGKIQPSIDNLPIEDFLQCYLVVNEWTGLNIRQLNQMKRKGKKKKKTK